MNPSKEIDLLASLGGSEPVPEFTQSKPVSGACGLTSGIRDRAVAFLGSGLPAEQVAAALGVEPSRIAQMLSEEVFALEVSELKCASLQKHNKRDSSWDDLEDKLLVKLHAATPLMIRPETILKAVQIANNAKRRGSSAPLQVNAQQNVVNLILPTVIVDKVTMNSKNQVIRARDQDLITMSSSALLKTAETLVPTTNVLLPQET